MKNTFALLAKKLAKWTFLLKRVSSPSCSNANHIAINSFSHDAIQPFASFLFSEGKAIPAKDQPATTNNNNTNEKDETAVSDSMQWKRRVDDDLASYNTSLNNYKTKPHNNDATRPFASLSFFAPIKNFIMKIFIRRSVIIVIAFVITNLFLASNAIGQAASSTWALTSNANASNSGNVSGGTHSFVISGATTSYNGTDGALANNWSTSFVSTKYYQFTISPTSGNNLTVTSISFFHISHIAEMTAQVFYSLNGFSTAGTQVGSTITTNSNETSAQFVSPALSIAVNSGQTLTVRVYGAAANTSRQLGVKTFVISGTSGPACTPPGIPTVTTPVNYCIDGAASALTATGSNLLWYTSSSGGTGSSTAPTPSTSVAATTIYYVSQSNPVGCEGPRTPIVVNVNTLPTASAVKNDIACFNTNTGQITITASGGSGTGYTYSIFNGIAHPTPPVYPDYQAANIFNGLPVGTYQIRVKDSNGCQSKLVQ